MYVCMYVYRRIVYSHHHSHLEIYSAITFAAIGAVQKSYEQQQTLTNVKTKGKIMG